MGFLGYLLGRVEGNIAGEQTAELTDYDAVEYARQQVGLTRSLKIKSDSSREVGFDQGFVEGTKRKRRK